MDNTAREYQTYTQTKQNDNVEVKKNNENKSSTSVKISRTECFLLGTLAVVMMVCMISLVSAKVSTTISQQELQRVDNSINSVASKNVDLRQEVGELTNSQRLTSYAKTHDMALSNDNVRNVSK